MAQEIYQKVTEYLIQYGFQVLGGIIILLIGFKLAAWAAKLTLNFCIKKNWDITLSKFIASVIRVIVLVFVGLMALEKFGVTISPLIASVSALIFGASFAFQAPLSNYAAGLMVIVTRPFVVGNAISVQGVYGVVQEVKLPCTVLETEDGEKITIPNKEIVGQILYNSHANKVVEKTVGISYSDDPEKAIRVIRDTLSKFPAIVQKPEPQVGIDNFGSSSIDLGVRYWAPHKGHYHLVHEVNLAIFKALQEAKITIPFPQQEVRILNK